MYELIKSADFCGNQCDIYSSNNEMAMTASQLGNCLQYSEPIIAVNKLVSRNSYLRNEEFSVVTKLVSTDGKQYDTRVFTEDGIYEVTMLAKTEKAKEFRAFVRKLLKSLRKGETTLIKTTELQEIEIKAKADRATAMRMNAENRRLKLLLSNPNWQGLSDVALQTMGIKAVEMVTGQDLGNMLPKHEKTYSATEVAEILGIKYKNGKPGINLIGTMANNLGLKGDGHNSEYGLWVMDKSRSSTHECNSFRYNTKGIKALAEAFNITNYTV